MGKIKEKMKEWSKLAELSKKLEHIVKSDDYADQVTAKPGVSERGIEARRADTKVSGNIAHGYQRVGTPEEHLKRAKDQHKAIIKRLKAQKSPDLPKSELQKGAFDPKPQKIGATKSGKDVMSHDHYTYSTGFTEQDHKDAANAHYSAFENSRDPAEKKQHLKMTQFHTAKLGKMPASRPSLEQPKPSVATPYVKKAQVIPAAVSAPVVINRVTTSSPKIISGPTELNSYTNKDVVKKLKKKAKI